MIITRKHYNELVASRDGWRNLALRCNELNKDLHKTNESLLEGMKQVHASKAKLVREIFKAIKRKTYTDPYGAKVVYYGSIRDLEKRFCKIYADDKEVQS